MRIKKGDILLDINDNQLKYFEGIGYEADKESKADKGLKALNKSELEELAKEKGIDLVDAKKKEEIIAAIEAYEADNETGEEEEEE